MDVGLSVCMEKFGQWRHRNASHFRGLKSFNSSEKILNLTATLAKQSSPATVPQPQGSN